VPRRARRGRAAKGRAEEPGAQDCLRRLEAARASVGEAEMLAWAEITQK
jgi:hypothetical protein